MTVALCRLEVEHDEVCEEGAEPRLPQRSTAEALPCQSTFPLSFSFMESRVTRSHLVDPAAGSWVLGGLGIGVLAQPSQRGKRFLIEVSLEADCTSDGPTSASTPLSFYPPKCLPRLEESQEFGECSPERAMGSGAVAIAASGWTPSPVRLLQRPHESLLLSSTFFLKAC